LLLFTARRIRLLLLAARRTKLWLLLLLLWLAGRTRLLLPGCGNRSRCSCSCCLLAGGALRSTTCANVQVVQYGCRTAKTAAVQVNLKQQAAEHQSSAAVQRLNTVIDRLQHRQRRCSLLLCEQSCSQVDGGDGTRALDG
jgi:hypothetical protein